MAQTKVAARRVALIPCSLTALPLRPMPTATTAPSLNMPSIQIPPPPPPHARGDDAAVAEVAVQPGRRQAGQQCAAFVGVGVVSRQQRAADAEVVDQFALQVDRERRVVLDAD